MFIISPSDFLSRSHSSSCLPPTGASNASVRNFPSPSGLYFPSIVGLNHDTLWPIAIVSIAVTSLAKPEVEEQGGQSTFARFEPAPSLCTYACTQNHSNCSFFTLRPLNSSGPSSPHPSTPHGSLLRPPMLPAPCLDPISERQQTQI